jgi:CHAD domain-containing protein
MRPRAIHYPVRRSRKAQVLARLLDRFRCLREVLPPREETTLDTFDWRLHTAGRLLSATRRETGWTLSLDEADGEVLQRRDVDELPAFDADLPPGPIRDAVAPLIEMRRLLPIVRVELRGQGLRVLDGEDKTVARIRLAHGWAEDPARDRSRAPLSETLQLVPVRGYTEAFDAARDFLERELGLAADASSGIDAALRAIGRTPGDYSSKLDLVLDPQTPAAEAVRAVFRRLLATIDANRQGVIDDLDSEFLHDFRVAVRRTRTGLGQLRELFPDGRLKPFRSGFGWLGGVTGPCRDLDVYLLKMGDYRDSLPSDVREDLQPLGTFLQRRKSKELDVLVQALESDRYRKLIRDWQGFLDEDVADAVPEAGRLPIVAVAGERIAGRFEGVLERGNAIRDDTPAEALHRLRIDCKKLRYLLEFFRSLYEPGDLRRQVGELKRLQDNLGDFNDLQVQQESLQQYARQMGDDGSATTGALLAMGRLVQRLEERQAAERRRFHKRFDRFAAASNRKRMKKMLAASAAGTATPGAESAGVNPTTRRPDPCAS